ncbi:MAG TPA: response regulator transcription factor [Candidatus Dormibacteraeota bacterium]|nr:response regulator transcription factor [Candidatus Dormibacteraeota bacterium]
MTRPMVSTTFLSPVRVLIVDDHTLLAHALETAFSHDPEIEVVGCATSIAEAVQLVSNGPVDIAVIDFHLPDGNGAEAAERLRALNPAVRTAILTADGSGETFAAAVDAGINGFAHKWQPLTDVIDLVKRVARGEQVLPTADLLALVDRQRRQHSKAQNLAQSLSPLTARERQILDRVTDGLDNRTIAATMGISPATVRSHVQRILGKLGLHSKLEAMAWANDAGLRSRAS